MNSKIFLNIFGLLICILAAGVVGGCGSTTSTSTLYDSPNWMPDGRIICNKVVMTSSQQLYGPGVSESHGYIAALTINDKNEIIKEENLFEGTGNQITCSPTGELIAYLAASADEGITFSDYKGNKTIVPNSSNPSYLDWSPDAKKLVYSDINRNLYVINRDGAGKTLITSETDGPIAWRIGENIFYSNLYLINANGSNGKYVFYGRNPQTFSTQEVICQGSDGIYKVIINNGVGAKLFSNYDRYTLKLSYDNKKIVGGAFGDPGIWVINIDGTGDKRLR